MKRIFREREEKEQLNSSEFLKNMSPSHWDWTGLEQSGGRISGFDFKEKQCKFAVYLCDSLCTTTKTLQKRYKKKRIFFFCF